MSATDIVTYHLFSIYIEAMWMVNVKTHEKKRAERKKMPNQRKGQKEIYGRKQKYKTTKTNK